MVRVALTGGIACGKSLVGSMFAERGIPVCDADHVAHGLMEPGLPVYERVVDVFGREIVGPGGEIDRRRLGRVVFGDPARLAELNALVHPAVVRAYRTWLEGLESSVRLAVVIIPLLYEAGLDMEWDSVVCVISPERLQVERLMRKGYSEQESRRRVSAQWPTAAKAARADYVIYNAGPICLVRAQAAMVLERMMERQHG